MRFKSVGAFVLLLAAVSFASNWGGRAQVPARKTWEYKAVTAQYGAVPASLGEEEMNRLGAEGWELVDTRSLHFKVGEVTQNRTDYFFKRLR
ncbi:MAG TPA: DUF4177 domain-containing protein [Pyrinomonadaceae bacterium]|nr:DUF4177 domain-containing protein [Pyrinomonadaceae bacterium]